MINTSRLPSASQIILRMVTGYWVTQIVGGAAYYSLVDHLEHQPMTAREFASVEGLDEVATGRFLRGCAEPGIIKLEENRYFTTELFQTRARSARARVRPHFTGDEESAWEPSIMTEVAISSASKASAAQS